MKKMKKILSLLLVLIMCFSVVPMTDLGMKASAAMTLAQLRQKFPHGKYWNHAGNPGSSNSVNNQNGYTSTPCSQHGVVGTSKQTCNGFQPSGTQLSWQCMGYAEKLGYDATGNNPRNNANGWYTYTSSSALDNLKPGDIVRYKNNGHSIYVTGVNGNTVTYTDCNSDGHCIIRWDVTISKSTLKSSFTHVRSAPSSVSPGPTSCSCSTSYAGTYICTTSSLNLTIRSGHGSSYSAIGSIPPGATVTVSKASGTSSSDWAHVTYNGVTGYASMQYLSKKQATQQRDSRIGLWLSNSEMGSSISTIRTGEWLYLCYKLYDANTGDLLDTYNTSGGYTAKLTLYETNGTVAHTYTYTNDNNWISIRRNTPGNYKGELVFTWNSGGTTTSTVSINMVYEPRVTPSASDIQLNVTGTNTQTISISYSGATDSNSIYLDCTTSGDCFSYKWGSWSDHKMPLTITGVRAGQGVITIEMYDSDTEQIIATSKVYVTVTAPTYTVSYNANGGSGAPSTQTKHYNTTLTLSSTKPTRSGYTFLGWSTSSSATSASYSAGASYSSNADLNLYAVWKKNPTYTLSYSANGGSGAPSSQTGASTYTISSTEPTKTGYTFRGWAKSSSATTATYKSGDTISISENTTLYAVWKKVFFGDVNSDNVISDTDLLLLNKIALGKVEADCINKLKGDLDGDEKITSDDVQYLGNFLAKIDNKFPVESMFNDFVVTNNGKSTYKSGEAINKSEITAFVTYNNASYHTIDEGLTVSPEYASGSGQQKITVTLGDWSDYFYITVDNTVGYTLSYNANGGSGAPSGQTGSTSYTVSSTVPTRNGYTFLGWAKSSSATTPSYKPGNNISVSANTTLYAVWSSASAISTGSSYSTSVEFANQERYYTFTPSTSGDYIFESTGSLDTKVYVYNTSWTELGNDDDDGADSNFMLKINLTAGIKYYVKVRAYSSKTGSTSFSVKKEAPVTYTLNYNANGGSNAPSSQTGSTTYAISSTVPTRQGYTFLGWAKSSNSSIAPYTPGDNVTLTTDTTLYAVWKAAEAMEVFEDYEVRIDFAKQELYYTFTPDVSGEYMFESFSSIDTKVYVYDSSWKQIGFNDDDGVGNNFLLYINLTAGNKYYVKVGAYGSGTGALTFGVACEEEEHEHSYSSTVTKRPGCVSYGTREFKCSCGDTYTETINPLGHSFETEWTIDKKATCTEDGKKSHHCVRCDIGSAEEAIKATGHDFDGSKCKNCDYDKSSDCSCNCHKGGIAGFFFKIINFFEKLFGKNKVCECGVKH